MMTVLSSLAISLRPKAMISSTIASWLQAAGYRTAFYGKYLNGYTEADAPPPGWDEWHAANNDGYFQVEMPGGKIGYTRAGNFTRSAEGQLVTQQGYVVQPAITVPEGAGSITVSPVGTVSAVVA